LEDIKVGLIFLPVRSQEEIIRDLTKLKIEQEVLKNKENQLIDELLDINKEGSNGQKN
tara:strand:- start:329 stop:502 length:174 start_codon:yes stop_codon:yes gene_type:complete